MNITNNATNANSAHQAQIVNPNSKWVFVMWFGGPGKFDPLDKAQHDSAWYNYIYPIFLYSAKASLPLLANEKKILWCIYSKAYQERWEDDKKNGDSVRKAHVKSTIDRGAKDYIDHIKQNASRYNQKHVDKGYAIEVLLCETSRKFNEAIYNQTDASVSRVWYFGHARGDLWLSLSHNAQHEANVPVDEKNEIISVDSIRRNKTFLQTKFAKSAVSSKFFGCNTDNFAETWAETYNVKAEGARGVISFENYELEKLQRSATDGWFSYGP